MKIHSITQVFKFFKRKIVDPHVIRAISFFFMNLNEFLQSLCFTSMCVNTQHDGQDGSVFRLRFTAGMDLSLGHNRSLKSLHKCFWCELAFSKFVHMCYE